MSFPEAGKARLDEARADESGAETVSELLQALAPVPPPADLRVRIYRRLATAAPVESLPCEQARPLVSARLDGETIPDQEALEVHLANCTACTRFAVALEEQRELLRELPAAPVPADLQERIHARIAGYQQSLLVVLLAGLRRSRTAAWAAGVAVCALVFAGMGYWSERGQPPINPPGRRGRSPRTASVSPPHAGSGAARPAVPTRLLAAATPVKPSPSERNRGRVPGAPPVRVAARPRWVARRTPAAGSASSPRPAVSSPAPAALPPTHETTVQPEETSAPAPTEASPPPSSPGAPVELPPPADHRDSTSRAAPVPAPATDLKVAATETPPAPVESGGGGPAVSPQPPTFVDDSPEHAPVADVVPVAPSTSSPVVSTAANGGEVAFEAPPVDTEVARKPAPAPPADESQPTLARIRERLHRRSASPPVFPDNDEISRTARLTVWRSGF